ncbi:MAG: FxsA family protein [Streptosporangiales bacterium]|nr:FxsA family protein [Streptosporangiales bacterium]
MPLVLFVAFVVVPVVEIYVIVKVGGFLGVLPTVGLLLAVSLFGAWLVRREGRRAWRALQQAVNYGQLPGRELADAALVLVGGALLLTPGFVTDAVGFCLVLPPTRPLVRRLLFALAARRARVLAARSQEHAGGGEYGANYGRNDGNVVRGEVVDDDDGDHRDHRDHRP